MVGKDLAKIIDVPERENAIGVFKQAMLHVQIFLSIPWYSQLSAGASLSRPLFMISEPIPILFVV